MISTSSVVVRAEPMSPLAPGASSATVLVIDDDPMFRAVAQAALQAAGAHAQGAADLTQARSVLRDRRVDLVLLDILLPDGNGLELLEELRASGSRLPVIVLTGAGDDDLVPAAFERGASDFLRKPVEEAILAHRVRFAVRASRSVQALERSRASLAEAQRIARLGSFELDLGDGTLVASAQLIELLDELGAPLRTLDDVISRVHPEDREATTAELRSALADPGADRIVTSFRLLRGAGQATSLQLRAALHRDAHGRVQRVVGTMQDITERQRRERTIEYLVTHDPQTGLLNHNGFERVAAACIDRARREQGRVALLQVGLARDQGLRARLGARRTEQLVREAGERLAGSSPEAIARVGPSTFLILDPQVSDSKAAGARAEQIVGLLARPFDLGDHQLVPDVVVGLALYPQDGGDVELLVQHVDLAMRSATLTDRQVVQRYQPGMRQAVEEQLRIESELHAAADQLLVEYQPQVDASARIVAVEALVRWEHPELGRIPPGRFIPLAEQLGLIDDIGQRVLEQGFAQLAAWRRSSAPGMRLSLNLSAAQLASGAVVDSVQDGLARHGLPGEAVVLELTESTLLGDEAMVVAQLTELTATGVGLAIDDFGTGFSSLSRLHRLPLTELKIDRSFVSELPDPEIAAVIRATIAVARGLGLRVVAEGVETRAQADWLLAEGCDLLQGYHLGRPMAAEALGRQLSGQAVPEPAIGSVAVSGGAGR